MDNVSLSGWRLYAAMVALVLPLLVPAALGVKAHLDIKNADIYRVPIAGYDPRDMLRGHYLIFRFEWPWADNNIPDENACADNPQNCCVCLSGDASAPAAHLQVCPPSPDSTCPAPIRGRLRGEGDFDIGINRYYIPETRARELEKLLRDGQMDFKLGLATRPGTKAIIEKLYISDETLDDFLARTPVSPE